MATVSKSIKDYQSVYNGFERMNVGLGAAEPNIYATKNYQKKKVDRIIMGGLQEIIYAGAEHDLRPLALVIGYEPTYNTILAFNLNYVPKTLRMAIINLVLKSNMARIKGQKPLVIDYKMIVKAIPEVSSIVRRYKIIGIKVVEQYPLVEWVDRAKEKSPWETWYRRNQKKPGKTNKNGFIKPTRPPSNRKKKKRK